MPVNEYICLNGEFLKSSGPCLFANNRAFRYGDALIENIRGFATQPQFLDHHLERLKANMHTLSMDVPGFLTVPNIQQLIVRLLNKNRVFSGAGIRLTLFRDFDNTLIPVKNSVSFLMESLALEHSKYGLNEKGLSVDICRNYTKSTGPLSDIPTATPLLYLMAGIETKENNMDALILLNQAGRLVETINSNIFLVSGSSIFTPGLNQGCIPGIMRKIIIALAGASGYMVNDQSSLTPAALHDAEEVFLTNALEGIRWVGAYEQTRYFNKTAKLLTGKLNELAFKA